MADQWEEKLSCALECSRCEQKLSPDDPRILSVYDHQAICKACKQQEEQRPDYQEQSKETIAQLMAETELNYGDPGGYCYHHFYPYKCR